MKLIPDWLRFKGKGKNKPAVSKFEEVIGESLEELKALIDDGSWTNEIMV